ncbi:hypothetical protein [Antrihabitans stalactiti]|uniref:hypothetical protein n=1 Tax=Antrihabitans stalactiti TaxID=2584121 RepID=UPI00146A3212|nr:hypothetical protein [Antrihabitans stalactiti]
MLIGCAGCGLLFAPGGVTARDAERYEMIRVIGRGGMGVTWLARDRITDRQVCVKQCGGTAVARRFTLIDLDRNGRDVSHVSLLRPSG